MLIFPTLTVVPSNGRYLLKIFGGMVMILEFLVGVVGLDLAEGLRRPLDVVVQFQVQEGVEGP